MLRLCCLSCLFAANVCLKQDCQGCSAGYYCPIAGAAAGTKCPDFTTSVVGGKTKLDCRCQAGYSCQYTQYVTATITVTGNVTDFLNNVGGVRDRFIQAVATAGGVPVNSVKIMNVTSTSVGAGQSRRLLSVADAQPHFHVHVRVDHASYLRNLDGHLNTHVRELSARGVWNTGKDVSVVRGMGRG